VYRVEEARAGSGQFGKGATEGHQPAEAEVKKEKDGRWRERCRYAYVYSEEEAMVARVAKLEKELRRVTSLQK